MWSALGSMMGYGTEQPPYDCAWPLKDVGDLADAKTILAQHHEQIQKLHNDAEWSLMDFTDPEGSDMRLFSRPQIGTYHALKATFTIPNITAKQFIDLVGSSDLAKRQLFSADCVGLTSLQTPTENSELVHAKYWAPPPVAGRDFCFLVSHKDNGDGSIDLWGCSVDSPKCPQNDGMSLVRAASLWGWKLIQAGDNVLALYCNMFDPRGWTPGFLLAWMKTTASKEFCAIRAVLTGKEVKVDKVDLTAVGVSQEEAEAQAKEAEAKAKEANA